MADEADTTDSEEWVIYGLSRLTGPIRYVGKAKSARARLLQHKSKAQCGKAGPLHDWLRKLIGERAEIVITILDAGFGSSWEETEQRWIALFDRSVIFNKANGGRGNSAIPQEARKRAGEKLQSRIFTADHRRRISESKMGCKRPDASARCRDMARANTGKKMNLSNAERVRRADSASAMAKNLTRWNKLSGDQKVDRAAKIAASVAKSWARLSPQEREQRCRKIAEGKKAKLNSAN